MVSELTLSLHPPTSSYTHPIYRLLIAQVLINYLMWKEYILVSVVKNCYSIVLELTLLQSLPTFSHTSICRLTISLMQINVKLIWKEYILGEELLLYQN